LRETNLVGYVLDLDFRVGLNNFSKVILKKRRVQEVEVSANHIMIQQFMSIHLLAALESK
jgi:hypothetical protein